MLVGSQRRGGGCSCGHAERNYLGEWICRREARLNAHSCFLSLSLGPVSDPNRVSLPCPQPAMLQADDEDDLMEERMKSPFGSSFRTFNATDYKPIGEHEGVGVDHFVRFRYSVF